MVAAYAEGPGGKRTIEHELLIDVISLPLVLPPVAVAVQLIGRIPPLFCL